MRLPIPADWDGKWQCIQVSWPDSTLWTAYLSGLLSQFRRGWTWDERSGELMTAIAIGNEIWRRNAALLACSDCKTPEPVYIVCGGGDTSEVDEMGNYVTKITIENGQLFQWYGECCKIPVTDGAGTTVPLPDDTGPIADDPGSQIVPPVTTYNACGGALALAEALYLVAQGMYEAVQESPIWIPGVSDGWLKFVKTYAAPLSLKDKYVIEGVIDASVLHDLGYAEEEIFDIPTKQAVICALAKVLTPTGAALTDADFAKIDAAFNANMGWDVAIFGAAANAIGKSQLSNLYVTGSMDSTHDCDCPQINITPPDSWTGWAWKHTVHLDTIAELPATITAIDGKGEWVVGIGFRGVYTSWDRYLRMAVLPDAAGSKITNVAYKLSCPAGLDTVRNGTNSITLNNTEIASAASCPVTSAGGSVWWVAQSNLDSAPPATLDLDTYFGFSIHDYDDDPATAIIVKTLVIAGTGADPFTSLGASE